MRYYQPPQQQLVRIGNTADKELQFTTGMMERMYQGMMQSEQMRGNALNQLYGLDFSDSETMSPMIEQEAQGLHEAYKKNPLSLNRYISDMTQRMGPTLQANRAHTEAIKRFEALENRHGDDLMTGINPRRMSISKDGKPVSPESFSFSHYNPSTLDKELLIQYKDAVAPRVELGQYITDPMTGESVRQYVTVTGMDNETLDQNFHPDEDVAIERIVNRFKTNSEYRDVWLQRAEGDPDEAVRLAAEDTYIRAKNLLGERYTDSVSRAGGGTGRGTTPRGGDAAAIEPTITPPTHNSRVLPPTGKNIPKIKEDVFIDGNITQSDAWRDETFWTQQSKIQETLSVDEEVRVERIQELEGKIGRRPSFREVLNMRYREENDWSLSNTESSKLSTEEQKELSRLRADQRELSRIRTSFEKREEMDSKQFERKGKKELEILNNLRESLNLSEDVPDRDVYNIAQTLQGIEHTVRVSNYTATSEDFNLNKLTGQNIIGIDGRLNMSDADIFVLDKGEYKRIDNASGDAATQLAKRLGIEGENINKTTENIRKFLETQELNFMPVGGPMPGSIEISTIRGEKIYLRSNREIEHMSKFAHTVFNSIRGLDFTSQKVPHSFAVSDGENVFTVFQGDSWRLVGNPSKDSEGNLVTQPMPDYLDPSKSFENPMIDMYVEITSTRDNEGNLREEPETRYINAKDYIEEITNQLDEYLINDKKRDEITKYIQASYRGEVSFMQAVNEISTDLESSGQSRTSTTSFGDLSPENSQFVSNLLTFISAYEGQDYNRMWGQSKTPEGQSLTEMTLTELINFQRSWVGGGRESGAAGRYQFIRPTLEELADKLGYDRDTTYFSEEVQDTLAFELLKEIGILQYLKGSLTQDTFMDRLAGKWAALPKKDGRSAYAGVGSNKAHVSREEVKKITTLPKNPLKLEQQPSTREQLGSIVPFL